MRSDNSKNDNFTYNINIVVTYTFSRFSINEIIDFTIKGELDVASFLVWIFASLSD